VGASVQRLPSPRSSLESATKLDRARRPNEVQSSWLLNLYPNAAEASGCFVGAARPTSLVPSDPDEDRSAEEAIRRARASIRRYCAENRLNRLGTLTYAGEGNFDPRRLRRDLGSFFRRLRADLGESFPYVWVPEWHPKGHGLHAHFAVGRYVYVGRIREAWPHGFPHIKLLGDLPVGSGTLGEARLAAWYLAKYVGKSLGADTPAGLHRYDVAQGYPVKVTRLRGISLEDVLDRATAIMGREPEYVWDSASDPTWDRPHSVWARWT
jgi:hypothetical protein